EILFNNLFKKNNFNKQELEIIKYLYFEILIKIKICDNACGSGSFLIAAGDMLLRLYSRVLKILEENLGDDKEVKEVLKDIRKSPTRNYYIVRQIIVNNLYGVDIMEGAVEIAKLRFWLWLISQVDPKKLEDKKIETLPNLDFNLIVGNTLIGFVDIEDIEFDFIGKQKTLTAWLGDNKIEWLKNLAKQKQKFKTLPAYEAIKLKEKLNKELEKAREFLNEKFYNMLKSKGIKISKEEFLELKPFHWGFEFYEVFDLEKPKEERGFDVIIGNPPYVASAGRGEISMKIEEMDKEIFKQFYEVAKGQFDLYTIFIERSLFILQKRNGKFGYIIPDAILVRDTNYYIRNFILEKTSIRQIILAGRCFVGVDNSNSILLISYPYSPENVLIGIYIDAEYPENIALISLLPKIRADAYINYLKQSELRNLENKEFLIGATSQTLHILNFLKGTTKPLEKFIQMRRGEELGKKSDILVEEKKNENYLPIIAGENFDRYQKIKINQFISLKDITKNKEFYKKGKLIFRQTSDKIRGALDCEGVVTLKSVYNVIPKNVNPKFLLCLLNSNLCNWFYLQTFGIYRKTFPQINQSSFRKIPIKLLPTQQPFIILCDYMLFLNATEERRTTEKELIEFIDKQIIDSLVYELYFKEELKTNLLQLVEPYLKDIENLKSDEEKLKTIKQVVEKIKSDIKIIKEIEKIKNHKWVKIIEGEQK
ncbi:Eco57I restriction-modification methylase domain-containing protein, partial [Caldisericum sp.]|uniref:Eco57I restriction-modification methylase domain-containing protein n=1 Tax=Caldisericum sp. TaxID=2499687 RepID=UPI003D103B1F